MANRGPDTNGSQFFITLKSCPHLNGRCGDLHVWTLSKYQFQGKHVVFGRVASGYEEVIKKIADVHVDHKDRPTVPVVIVNCGELELRTRKVDGARSALHNDRLEQTSAKEAKHGKRKISAPNREDRGQHRNPSPSLPSDVPRKRKNNIDYSGSHAKSPVLSDSPPRREMHLHETEEEYDARLEREEVERLTAERKSKLQKLRNVDEDMQISKGVRFKGLSLNIQFRRRAHVLLRQGKDAIQGPRAIREN
jgi:peptidyl-prolyl isomerase G (cyclophilin G)